MRSGPVRNTGTTSSPGTACTIRPTPERNGATTPASPRLPSGNRIRLSPSLSAWIIGCSVSVPPRAMRSIGMPFMKRSAIARRSHVFPK